MTVVSGSIHKILTQNNYSFFIPPFQRAYSWGKQELGRFFSDIMRIIEGGRDVGEYDRLQHFFGVIVLKDEKVGLTTRTIVIDGQQRLTTTLLLLIALRDKTASDFIKDDINNSYLTNQSSTFSDKIKLKQVTKDWDAYRALVNSEQRLPGKITDGYEFFCSALEQYSCQDMEYINALERLNVACIFLDKNPIYGEDPQIIFETLNSLGKPLTFADLVRNYVILSLSSEDQTEIYEQTWHPRIESVLHERTSHFFRDLIQYKQSKNHKVASDNNAKELYAVCTKLVEDPIHYGSDRKAFIKDAARYAVLYSWLVEIEVKAEITKNVSNNKIIIELLRNIFHDIKADAFKPFVLGLLEFHQYGLGEVKLPDEQLVDALSVIRTYLIRRRVLKISQGENKDIPTLCGDLLNERDVWLSNAKNRMFALLSKGMYALRVPNDGEIADGLKRVHFYKDLSKYSKFILGKIEESLSKVSVNFRDKGVTIEHIMPQSINNSAAWKTEIGDEWKKIHEQYLHNIGNLILTDLNGEMGNKSLMEKKKKLSASNLQYRFDVLENDTWRESDIINHQAKMINRFLTTFPLPPEMQQASNWGNSLTEPSQEFIYPYDEECHEIATKRKPIVVTINDEMIDVSDWQDVYLEFLRWILKNNPVAFGGVMKQKTSSMYPYIVTKSDLITLVDDENDLAKKYKRLSDGCLLSNVVSETEDNPLYIFINRNARFFMNHIREIMLSLDMNDESVSIELKPIKHRTNGKPAMEYQNSANRSNV